MSNMINYPVGSIYITSTNTNPTTLGIPGTWELVDKKFKDVRIDGLALWSNNTSKFSATSLICKRTEHLLDINLTGTTAATYTDDENVSLGNLTLSSNLGVTGSVHRNYFLGSVEAAGALLTAQWYAGIGLDDRIAIADIITNTHGNVSLPTGSEIKTHFSHIFGMDEMVDSVCDKFYWKKTSDAVV